jgi:4-diphosphocytidyl-2-C-methyl-D-erythritol kinase
MILFPPAKINLGLNILGKREDGYHTIESCMFAIPLRDVLEILPSEKVMFVQTGIPVKGDEADNLVMKAFRLLNSRYAIPNVYIHLQKNIPMGAGLGGGSADATYTLLGLNELFSLGLSTEVLQNLATELGSDCPFFVVDQPQLAKGRGEVLSPINVDLKGYYLKIINPGIHIGTAEAYSNVEFTKGDESLESVLSKSPEDWRNELVNGFEKSVFQKYPMLKGLKEQLYVEGALYASMTGSGSTVFGLFTKEPAYSHKELFESVIRL